jgi:Fic family protein
VSKVLKCRWTSDLTGPGLSRRDRSPCTYEAYLPDPLVGRKIVLDGMIAADVADAEAAIIGLNIGAKALVDIESLGRLLLRAEAVASSRIEGLEVGARRILRAEVAQGLNEWASDVTATEVLGNIDAMTYGIQAVETQTPITVELLLEVHRRLVAGTRLAEYGGRFREVQNWIGGSDYNPCSAAFVPPPSRWVEPLMQDLCAFASTEDLPAVAQAAIAHAQFETIHPFVDGNGRTGRALIHLVLRRRGLAPRVLAPVSLVLATWARSYVDGLTAFRHVGPPSSRAALEGLNVWVGRFSAACSHAVADATSFEERAAELEGKWRGRLGKVRANSGTDLLLRSLPGAPVLTIEGAALLIGRTFKPAAEAIQRLVDADILRQITVGRRNRAFEAPDVIAAFTALERQLGSPTGDTRISKPERRVPRRVKGETPERPSATPGS